MEQLIWTPEDIARAKILPLKADTIRLKVRQKKIKAKKLEGSRIYIHIDAIRDYAAKFLDDGDEQQAGPHASGENDTCRVKRKVSTKGKTPPTGGRPTPMEAGKELAVLLGL